AGGGGAAVGFRAAGRSVEPAVGPRGRRVPRPGTSFTALAVLARLASGPPGHDVLPSSLRARSSRCAPRSGHRGGPSARLGSARLWLVGRGSGAYRGRVTPAQRRTFDTVSAELARLARYDDESVVHDTWIRQRYDGGFAASYAPARATAVRTAWHE